MSLASGHCLQEFYFECRSKKLRALRLQQYGMTDKERASLPARLTHNQFNKAAWKSWHASMHEDEQQSPAKVRLALLLHSACIKQKLQYSPHTWLQFGNLHIFLSGVVHYSSLLVELFVFAALHQEAHVISRNFKSGKND